MRKTALFTAMLIFFLIPLKKVYAQFYFYNKDTYDTPLMFEAGVSLGIMNCTTDIGGGAGGGRKYLKDMNIGNNQFNSSIYVSAIYKEAIGLRLEGTYGHVKAYDSILKSVKSSTGGRYQRNLSFRSKIAEISLITEIYPLFIITDWSNSEQGPPKISPYLMAGIGYYAFNPQTNLNGRIVDLQPLSTEGEGFKEYPDRKPYKLHQINFPLGVGVKFELSPLLNLRTEFLYRILQTDYLDDVSTRYIDPSLYSEYFTGSKLSDALALNDRRSKTDAAYPVNPSGGQIRGNPKNNDAYFTWNIKLGVSFGRQKIKYN